MDAEAIKKKTKSLKKKERRKRIFEATSALQPLEVTSSSSSLSATQQSIKVLQPLQPKFIEGPVTEGFSLQFVSDIHLELRTKEPSISKAAKYLALLGDIGYPRPQRKKSSGIYKSFVKSMAQRYEKVFLIAGNHEFYTEEILDTKERIKSICDEINKELAPKDCEEIPQKVLFMDKESYLLENKYRILGCTLWSRVTPECRKLMNDYEQIWYDRDGPSGPRYALVPEDVKGFHQQDVRWLQQELQKANENGEYVIVLSHHSPTILGSDPRYRNHPVMNAYYTDLEYLMGGNMVAWLFGHTHYHLKANIQGTAIGSNPVGYPSEQLKNTTNYVLFIPTQE